MKTKRFWIIEADKPCFEPIPELKPIEIDLFERERLIAQREQNKPFKNLAVHFIKIVEGAGIECSTQIAANKLPGVRESILRTFIAQLELEKTRLVQELQKESRKVEYGGEKKDG